MSGALCFRSIFETLTCTAIKMKYTKSVSAEQQESLSLHRLVKPVAWMPRVLVPYKTLPSAT